MFSSKFQYRLSHKAKIFLTIGIHFLSCLKPPHDHYYFYSKIGHFVLNKMTLFHSYSSSLDAFHPNIEKQIEPLHQNNNIFIFHWNSAICTVTLAQQINPQITQQKQFWEK